MQDNEQLEKELNATKEAFKKFAVAVFCEATLEPVDTKKQYSENDSLMAVKKLASFAKETEQKYRQILWLNHGHTALYGDDGEMQCSSCGRCGVDYKRDPIEKVETAYMEARLNFLKEELAGGEMK